MLEFFPTTINLAWEAQSKSYLDSSLHTSFSIKGSLLGRSSSILSSTQVLLEELEQNSFLKYLVHMEAEIRDGNLDLKFMAIETAFQKLDQLLL